MIFSAPSMSTSNLGWPQALYARSVMKFAGHDCHVMDGRHQACHDFPGSLWTGRASGIVQAPRDPSGRFRQFNHPVSLFPSPDPTQDQCSCHRFPIRFPRRRQTLTWVCRWTAFHGHGLFDMVYINPKETSYT